MAHVIGKACVDVMHRGEWQTHPLGSPGGAAKVGPMGVDTQLVAGMPPQEQ